MSSKAIAPFVVGNPFGGNPSGVAGAPPHRAKSVRMRQIRDKLTTLLDAPVILGCVPCAVFLEVEAGGDCPGCGKPFIRFEPGTTRESLFLESMWRAGTMDPNGGAARLLMEYRFGRVPLSIRTNDSGSEGASRTAIKLTVVEVKQTADEAAQPELLEKAR